MVDGWDSPVRRIAALLILGLALTGLPIGQVSSAEAASVALGAAMRAEAAGVAVSWGSGNVGRLGTGVLEALDEPPTMIAGALAGRDVTAVTAGGFLNCALADGLPFCWGTGFLGRGVGEQSSVPVPVDVTGVLAGKTITAIDAGPSSACVVAGGAVFCWGSEALGGATGEALTPVAVDMSGVLAGRTATDVSVGDRHACMVADGRAYCWGFGQNAELGQGNSRFGAANIVGVGPPIPVDDSGVLSGRTVTDVEAGPRTTCALADAQVFCWGDGGQGTMGNGPASTYPTYNRLPVSPDTTGALAGRTITDVTVGDNIVCVLASGVPVCWGASIKTSGGFSGPDDDSDVPVALSVAGVPPGTVLESIQTSDGLTCVIGGGSLYCWDGNRRADPPVRRDVSAAAQSRPVVSVAMNEGAAYAVASTAGPVPVPQWPAPSGTLVIGPSEADHDPAASWDVVALTESRLRVAGWAFDPDSPGEATAVHLYDAGPEGTAFREFSAGRPRPDLANAVPGAGSLHGFDETIRLSPGSHTVCLFAINSGRGTANPRFGCRFVTVGGPVGTMDSVRQTRPGIIDVTGWAADPDMPGLAVDVHLYVYGPSGRRIDPVRTSTVLRWDVQAALPWAGYRTGFAAGVPISETGDYQVCAYVLKVRPPATNPFVGCRAITIANPLGIVDSVRVTEDSIIVSGWAAQPGNPEGAAEVIFSGAGNTIDVRAFADLSRPDVQRAFPQLGDHHGFEIALPRENFLGKEICGEVFAGIGGISHQVLSIGAGAGQTRKGCFRNPTVG